MTRVSIQKSIAAPRERVFDLFTDLRNAPARVAGIKELEVLTEGPVGVGTRFRETRTMFKRDATEEMEITAFQRPESYQVGANSCGCRYRTIYKFLPDGSDGQATRVEMEFTAQPETFFAKLMMPLGKLLSGTMIKCMDADMGDLKAVAEEAN